MLNAVPTPVPSPETPVEIGRPVPLVNTIAEGVPRAGVVNVGDVASTIEPEPVTVLPRAVTVPDVGSVKDVFAVVVRVVENAPDVVNEPAREIDLPPMAPTVVESDPAEFVTSPVIAGN